MYDVAIVGCGVIGAAAAYYLSMYDLKILVLEKENDIAMGATRANSAIIHSGYDPEPGTLMARLNVRGCEMAKDLCDKLSVPYRQCGSLVLAFSAAEDETVKILYDRGVQNGVKGMMILTAEEVHEMEPQVSDQVTSALYAPSAGIVNPWEYALAFAEVAVLNGVELYRNSEVTDIRKTEKGFEIMFRQIAGIMARRIVAPVKEGDTAKQGEQFGFIKFGSRVDMFFPLDTKICVKVGDKVKGGLDIIADVKK